MKILRLQRLKRKRKKKKTPKGGMTSCIHRLEEVILQKYLYNWKKSSESMKYPSNLITFFTELEKNPKILKWWTKTQATLAETGMLEVSQYLMSDCYNVIVTNSYDGKKPQNVRHLPPIPMAQVWSLEPTWCRERLIPIVLPWPKHHTRQTNTNSLALAQIRHVDQWNWIEDQK